MKNKLILFSILVLFAIVIMLKQNLLQSSTHSEYSNYFNFIQAWHHQSPAQCYFSPTNTYENTGDKFVKYWPGLTDLQGNCYYNSFPPLSFQIGYFFWWLCGFPDLVKFFIAFNFIIHFIIALSGFEIVRLLLRKKIQSDNYLPPLITLIALLFTPTIFWFYTSYFFIENFALLLLAVHTCFLIRYYLSPTRLHFSLTVISLLLLCYTEIIGYFAFLTFALLIYSETKKIRSKKMMILLLSTSFVFFITLFQYYLIALSASEVLHNLAVRFVGRSGYFSENLTENKVTILSPELYIRMWYLIKTGMLPLLLLTIALFFSFLFRIKSNEVSKQICKQKFWWLVSLPVVLHFFIFINANALHDQLIVKLVFPLSIISGLLIGIFSQQKNSRWIWYSFIAFAISIFYYPFIFINDVDDTQVQKFANRIKKECSPKKTIVVVAKKEQYYFGPSLFYHSNRNCYLITDTIFIKDVTKPLTRTIADSSVVYTVDDNWEVTSKKSVANY